MDDEASAPTRQLRELAHQSLRAGSADLPSSARVQLLKDVQSTTHLVAARLLVSPELLEQEEDESTLQELLPRAVVAPPTSFFELRDSGRLHLPIIDWGGFRGYSVALWLKVSGLDATTKVDGADPAKFTLFRFANNSSTLGVEATLEPSDLDSGVMMLTVSSCAPAAAEQRRFQSAAAILSSGAPEWKHVQHPIRVSSGEWHLLVISHSLHYVKKSKVSCFVDAQLHFRDELVYPSGLVTASKCTIGGGHGAHVQIASASMYKEELSPELVAMLFRLGPSVSAFNRWGALPLPATTSQLTGGFFESSIAPSPIAIPPTRGPFSELCKAEVVFAFTAENVVNEDYDDLGVEWLSEGSLSGKSGKWLALESTMGVSAEIQQRNARLSKLVHKRLFPDYRASWFRALGIPSVAMLLDSVLTAFDKLRAEDQGSEVASVVESIVVDLTWIIKGLLLNNPINQQAVLQTYAFHMLAHVLTSHEQCLSAIWTPGSLVAVVEMVQSLFGMLPLARTGEHLSLDHPFQVSVWNTNPLVASAIRTLLLDFRLWTRCDFKTQSIFNHQLYGLACEHPQVFNDLHAVDKLLEILATFYASSGSLNATTATTAGINGESQNSRQLTEQADKERHWQQQCVQTLVEIIEVCLTNQSVHVHEVLEDELLETTYARSSSTANTNAAQAGNASSGGGATTASTLSTATRRGGVLSINLENIVWSDQSAATATSNSAEGDETAKPAKPSTPTSTLTHVQIRFSLLRDLRSIVRFLLTSQDATICASLLLLLRRLSVSFLDMRFGLVSSSIVDCLLFLMQPPQPTDTGGNALIDASASIRVRMACVPVLIYLLDWLESIEGRTVWCGIEEHLRFMLNGDGNFSSGFLELMMEFYFDPVWLLGVQHSIVMNDPTKKDSVLFPIATSAEKVTASIHDSGIVLSDSGLAAAASGGGASGNGDASGIVDWIKMASQFVGKRLSLAWEKRIAVIRMTALRSLSANTATSNESKHVTPVADMFDEGVSGILSLPLRGVLSFLPILLGRSSAHFREKVLMDINVKLKTDEALQDGLLLLKRNWADALLELSLVCSVHDVDAGATAANTEASSEPTTAGGEPAECGRAYGVDADKTGEDLVLDTIVSLLCRSMHSTRGWRAMTHVILALKGLQQKYDSSVDGASAAVSSIPPAVTTSQAMKSELLSQPLQWLCRATGIVIQRMARSRTILSRVLAENVQRLMFLSYETLLAAPLPTVTDEQHQQSDTFRSRSPARWSEAQVFLLNAVLDMNVRLIESTHHLHRVGLFPGLQILQRALPFVNSTALMERVVEALVLSFQQEMGPVAALKVYESVPTRDVFLSALVCLRRALVMHDQEPLLALLRSLTLRIVTSGAFTDELVAVGVTVPALSTLSEAEAVSVVLDALALPVNETELHDREEAGDMVPYFPSAQELRLLTMSKPDEQSTGSTSSSAGRVSRSRSLDLLDESDRVLWAALEVEANRMMESLRKTRGRERARASAQRDVLDPRQRSWTTTQWRKNEFTFRSEHEPPRAPLDVGEPSVWRIGSFESAFPARMRRALDVDFVRTADLRARKAGRVLARTTSSDKARTANKTRRQPSLTLELIQGLDDIVTNSPLSSPVAKASGQLLERVGRVVAAQGGGEIRDITADEALTQVNDEIDKIIDEFEEDKDVSPESKAEVEATERANMVQVSAVADGDETQQAVHISEEAAGFDPGTGAGVSADDHVFTRVECRRVVAEGIVLGQLFFCNKHLVFVPQQDADLNDTSDDKKSAAAAKPSVASDEAAPGLHRCWRWKYGHVVGVYLRRYRLRDSAFELFLRNGSSHFLDLPAAPKARRDELVRLLYSFLPRHIPKQWPGRAMPNLAATTKAWQHRQLSNFDYLMALNTFAGRSFNDLTQYPVFPWVLTNYDGDHLDLSDPSNFRDLTKPVGALNAARLQEYWDRYNSFDDPVIPKFLYGSHYSTCAGVVLFFLFRLEPFAALHQKMQGGAFDLPDRLFLSLRETWRMCNSQMSEVKELTPEFFCDPSFLRNLNGYELGTRHDGQVVGDVQLPPWANGSPEEFVRLHRAALESELVSQHLHEWIDLIFGAKQRGRAALAANNVFYYLTYYGVVDLDQIDDPFLRESMELQIAHFGQCPLQLFSSAHPKRNPRAFSRKLPGLSTPSFAPSTSNSVSSPTMTVSSPVVSSPGGSGGGGNTGSSGPVSTIPKPLSLAFQDATAAAQERRKLWSPVVTVKPIASSRIRLLKILPDRVVSVNELGVVELFHWKLLPRPQPTNDVSDDGTALTPPSGDRWANGFASSASFEEDNERLSTSSIGDRLSEDTVLAGLASPSKEAVSAPTCPWLIEVARDDSPFDYVPRVPVFEHHDPSVTTDSKVKPSARRSRGFPIAITSNGRVVVSGGARNGAIHFRLVDLDNGHVVGKASVVGHAAAVTCLSMDKWSYATPVAQHDDDQLLVSGAKDGTLALWRLSRVKPDLLFRLPRVSPRPILVLRGHTDAVRDCCVSSYLGLVLSCTYTTALAHFLYQDGRVAFAFEPAASSAAADRHRSEFSHVRISAKGLMLVVTRMLRIAGDGDEAAGTSESKQEAGVVVASICQVYNLMGVCVGSHTFDDEDVTDLQLSAEGDLIIFTLFPGTIRICRTDEYVLSECCE